MTTLGAALLAVAGCGSSAAWQAAQQNLPGAVMSVWGTSARDVYFVGGDVLDGSGPTVIRFDGQTYRRLRTGLTSGDLWWVFGPAPGVVFMSGTGGTILRYDPQSSTFERMPTPGDTSTLFGVWGPNAQDVWAAGGVLPGRTGTLWHFDGTRWEDRTATLPPGVASQGMLFKVWGRTASDVYAVGEHGTALHWDGAAWTAIATGTTARLLTVHGNAQEVIAVGGIGVATVFSGSGTSLQANDVADIPALNGVFVPTSGDPVAVGISGLVLRRSGGRWVVDPGAPNIALDFHAVWMDPDGGIWAVGGRVATSPLTDGIIWHFGSPVPASAVVGP